MLPLTSLQNCNSRGLQRTNWWYEQVMHAWLRLSGYQRLSMDVEEGLAQLMALLWLERQQPPPVTIA
jgi:Protein DA1